MSQTTPPNWSDLAEPYMATWLDLNAPFFEQAVKLLPKLTVDGPLSIPGVGPGKEIPLLAAAFPGRTILASDPAEGLLAEAQKIADLNKELDIHFDCCRFEELEQQTAAAAVSFFAVHVTKNPLECALAQLEHVKPGGWAALLYFPPIPDEAVYGPLNAIFEAARRIKPKSLPDWEAQLVQKLEEDNVGFELLRLKANWNFSKRDGYKLAMEALPHMHVVKHRAGEEFYNRLWEEWDTNPGVREEGGKWVGDVIAHLLIVQIP